MTYNSPIKTFLIRELKGTEYIVKGGIPPGQTAHNYNYHKIDLRNMSWPEAEELHKKYITFHETNSRLKNNGCKPAHIFTFIGKLRKYGVIPSEKKYKEILRLRRNQKHNDKVKITRGMNRRSDNYFLDFL
jgi:hypothetical protein